MAKGSRTRFTSSHVSSMSPRYGSFRLCACDGSNENCRYCFGTGRISAHFEKAKAGSSARRGKATSKIPNEKLVFLPPITSVKGPRVPKGKKSRQNRKSVDPDWIKCPKCLVNVRTYRITQHDEEKHGRSRKRAPHGLIYQRSWKNTNWVEAFTHPEIKQSTYKMHDLSLGGVGPETH